MVPSGLNWVTSGALAPLGVGSVNGPVGGVCITEPVQVTSLALWQCNKDY